MIAVQEQITQLMVDAEKAIAMAADLRALDDVRVHYLGKKGVLTEQLKQLGQLAPEERKAAGQVITKPSNKCRNGWTRAVLRWKPKSCPYVSLNNP